jgi:hypothetical protein
MGSHNRQGLSGWAAWATGLLLVLSVGASGCRSKQPRVVPDVLAPPVVAPVSARTGLALTIYSRPSGSGYAFVREARKVRLPAGRFVLSAPDIASDVVPETTRFQLLSFDEDGKAQSAGELYEQRYLYDQLGPERLLEKAEGQRVTAVWWAGHRKGQERSLTGTVLSSKEGVLLRLDDGTVVPIDSRARIFFPALPPDLVVEPTLTWNVGSFEAADAVLQLSYRAERFAWSADYVVTLAESENLADVEGWVTVVNEGDTACENAKLQLVAGTVNTVDDPPAPPVMYQAAMNMMEEKEESVRAQQESLGDFHLYTVEHPTTLPARSSKQVRFVIARAVPVQLEAEASVPLQSGSYASVLKARLTHDKGTPLDVPLPAGVARSSMLARSGSLVQVGQGSVEHTPVGEPWRVDLGSDANQITRVVVSDESALGRSAAGEQVLRAKVKVEARNASDRPRLRRIVIEPGHLRFVGLSSAEAKLEDPKRIVIETTLEAGKAASFELVVDMADPNAVGSMWGPSFEVRP